MSDQKIIMSKTLLPDLNEFICPACRGLGWVNAPEVKTCSDCTGSGWTDSEAVIAWLRERLREAMAR